MERTAGLDLDRLTAFYQRAFMASFTFPHSSMTFLHKSSLRLFRVALLGAIGLGQMETLRAIPPLSPLVGVDNKWRRFTSPHFELYSHNPEGPSREVLFNLEVLRAVFLERMRFEVRLQVPVTVYYFRSEKEFQAYAPKVFENQSQLAGFHLFQPDRAIISLTPGEDAESARQTVFHEFVHHLFRISERNPSLWYNEGTAEVLAAMEVEGKRVKIGAPLLGRTFCLRQEPLIPLDQLFTATHTSDAYKKEDHTGVFYAESWALLHYWYFGDSGFSPDAVTRFLTVAANGEKAGKADLRALFKQNFGCDYPEMLSRLSQYVRTGSYRAGYQSLPTLDPPESYSMQQVPLDEITVRLAELALRVLQSGAGKLVLLNAMTQRPNDSRSFEALGAEALRENDEPAAMERFEQAIAAGSQNPAVVRELAMMEGQRWFGAFNESFQAPADLVARLRSRLLRSIAMEPTQGASYAMLASVEAFAEIPDAKNINLILGHLPEMTDKSRALIGLSRIMLRLGKPETAVVLLDYLDSVALDQPDTRAVELLHLTLEADFPAIAHASAKAPAKMITAPTDAPGLKQPSVGLPDDL